MLLSLILAATILHAEEVRTRAPVVPTHAWAGCGTSWVETAIPPRAAWIEVFSLSSPTATYYCDAEAQLVLLDQSLGVTRYLGSAGTTGAIRLTATDQRRTVRTRAYSRTREAALQVRWGY